MGGVDLAFGLSALFIMHAAIMKTDDPRKQAAAAVVGTFVAGFCMVGLTW